MQLKTYQIKKNINPSEDCIILYIDDCTTLEYSTYFCRIEYVNPVNLHYLIPLLVWLSRYKAPCIDRFEQELINTGWTKR